MFLLSFRPSGKEDELRIVFLHEDHDTLISLSLSLTHLRSAHKAWDTDDAPQHRPTEQTLTQNSQNRNISLYLDSFSYLFTPLLPFLVPVVSSHSSFSRSRSFPLITWVWSAPNTSLHPSSRRPQSQGEPGLKGFLLLSSSFSAILFPSLQQISLTDTFPWKRNMCRWFYKSINVVELIHWLKRLMYLK